PIDARCKFALVVASRTGPTTEFPCAFYLHDPAWLSEEQPALHYSRELLGRTGGDYLTFVEARNDDELETLQCLLANSRSLESLERSHGVVFRTEPYAFNVTTHGRLFVRAASTRRSGCLALLEGKHLHQFTDRWGEEPRYCVPPEAAGERPTAFRNASHY